MKHVIIGTAGHVDHGKTTLIHALTGTNTDRLKEEQLRGMTIDLGFASFTLPDGTVVGIVDVPGHERFLKNMLAGAIGVDVVLMVIAADESVMPQTREHLDILRLLDVKNGVVALTKVDIVDRDWLEAVEEDIRSQLEGTFLQSAPLIRVSSTSRKGIDALKRALQSAVSRVEARNASLPFRLPVDRVFTRPGFGTVVTGTLVAGTMRAGDAVEIVPQQRNARIRGLQVHSHKVEQASAGTRVAVNLSGIEVDEIERGTQCAAPGTVIPTSTIDALLTLLPNKEKALKDGARVRLHIGTTEVIGRIKNLESRDDLAPGSRTYVQFRSESTFACTRGDRYVLRAYSPMQTIGGGIVLDASPSKHRTGDKTMLEGLRSRERGTPEDLIDTLIQGYSSGILRRDISPASSLAEHQAEIAIDHLLSTGKLVLMNGGRIIHSSLLATLSDRAVGILQSYHNQFPLRSGMPKEELRSQLNKEMDHRFFTALQLYWNDTKVIASDATTLRLFGFTVELNSRQSALIERLEEYYSECGITIPQIEDVCRAIKAPPDAVNALLKVGQERGHFVRVGEGAYYSRQTFTQLKAIIQEEIETAGNITVGILRDRTNSNRKFALMALEYFDSIRFTRRVGDSRTLFNP